MSQRYLHWKHKGPFFYIHIPKSAGLTFYHVLQETLGNPMVYKLGGDEKRMPKSSDKKYHKIFNLDDYHDHEEDWRNKFLAYVGHFNFGDHQLFSPKPFIVTTLREPLSRVLSYYEYQCRYEQEKYDMQEFLESNIECNNGMTRRLSGNFYNRGEKHPFVKEQILQSDYDRAEEHLVNKIDCVLLQEKFVEAMTMLRIQLDATPFFSIHNQKFNSNVRKQRIEDYPEEILDYIREINKFDLMLYKKASEIFQAKFNEIGEAGLKEVQAMKLLNNVLTITGQSNVKVELINQRLLQAVEQINGQGHLSVSARIIKLMGMKQGKKSPCWQLAKELSHQSRDQQIINEVNLAHENCRF